MVKFNVLAIANTFKVKEEIVIDFVTDNCKVIFHETYTEFVAFVPEEEATEVMLRIKKVRDKISLTSRFYYVIFFK